MTVLVTGGAASGKSEFAEKAACALSHGRKAYLATMISADRETDKKIAVHIKRRADMGFDTLECPYALPDAGALKKYDTVLLECLSNLTANVMFRSLPPDSRTAEKITAALKNLAASSENTVIVTNEVFSAGVSYGGETIGYMKALSAINRVAAAGADAVIECVCGVPVYYKGRSEEIFGK
jgi:adenosylcobinamide kinase/adenosylcobinamide-phosphate guanylyltransferase